MTGWISTIGARQVLGSVTVVRITASPSPESGTVAVVAAGVVFESAPQKREAATPPTGPGVVPVPTVGRTSPSMRTSRRPSSRKRTLPAASPQGAPPGATPWIAGSVGAGRLGASEESRRSALAPPHGRRVRRWRRARRRANLRRAPTREPAATGALASIAPNSVGTVGNWILVRRLIPCSTRGPGANSRPLDRDLCRLRLHRFRGTDARSSTTGAGLSSPAIECITAGYRDRQGSGVGVTIATDQAYKT